MKRVALIHDWLTGMRGGESVLEGIAELYPQAELFTLLYVEGSVSPFLAHFPRHTSLLQNVPSADRRYRSFLPFMPSLIERFDLTGFDLILSSSHCVAKGVRKPPGALHVSYVHAPMRYMWDRYDDYFGPGKSTLLKRTTARLVRKRLQTWDQKVSTPERVDTLIANSHFIAEQIQTAYHRKAQVIHPFADLSRFTLPRQPGSHYLMVTAFAPYKRVDLAIQAFNQLKLPLWIVGKGQDEKALRALAGPTIEFLGGVSNAEVANLYSRCKAFVFPGVEDFGITPIEAMAAGAPILALKQGGAVETVTDQTGLFFQEQTVDALIEAIQRMESGTAQISEENCRKQAQHFTKERFQREFKEAVKKARERQQD